MKVETSHIPLYIDLPLACIDCKATINQVVTEEHPS